MTETQLSTRCLGYARVSTYGQTLDAQLEQLRAAGCTKIFREKASGAQADRRELLRLLKHLVPGDAVTVTRIDRLARSTFDLFAIVKQIVDAGAQFRSLAEPWADTGCIKVVDTFRGAADDRSAWRASRCRARPDPHPHPHGRGPEPRQGAWAAHGPTAQTHPSAAGRGPAAPRRRRDVEGIGAEL